MSGLNTKQQLFADYVLAGKSQIEAHRLAGYDGKTENARAASASEILRNPNVARYIEEHREKAVKTTEVTLQWLLEQGVEILGHAKKDRAHAAAVSALKELGVLSGTRVEKSQRENTNREINDFSDEELENLLKEGDSEGAVAPSRLS